MAPRRTGCATADARSRSPAAPRLAGSSLIRLPPDQALLAVRYLLGAMRTTTPSLAQCLAWTLLQPRLQEDDGPAAIGLPQGMR